MRMILIVLVLSVPSVSHAASPWWQSYRGHAATSLALASMSTAKAEAETPKGLPDLPRPDKAEAPATAKPVKVTKAGTVKRLPGPNWKLNQNGRLVVPSYDYLFDKLVNTYSMAPAHLAGLTHQELLAVHDNVRNHGRSNLFLRREEPAAANCENGSCSTCPSGNCSRRGFR